MILGDDRWLRYHTCGFLHYDASIAPRQFSRLRLQRINDFYKRKTMEVVIAGTDPQDAVLAHENGGMSVVE